MFTLRPTFYATVRYAINGLSIKEIADILEISTRSASGYITKIKRTCGLPVSSFEKTREELRTIGLENFRETETKAIPICQESLIIALTIMWITRRKKLVPKVIGRYNSLPKDFFKGTEHPRAGKPNVSIRVVNNSAARD